MSAVHSSCNPSPEQSKQDDMGIYGFRMFSPDFCDQLMEVHEHA